MFLINAQLHLINFLNGARQNVKLFVIINVPGHIMILFINFFANDVFFCFVFQIRIQTRNTLSVWSDPILVTYSTASTLPDPVSEESFNITDFSYR